MRTVFFGTFAQTSDSSSFYSDDDSSDQSKTKTKRSQAQKRSSLRPGYDRLGRNASSAILESTAKVVCQRPGRGYFFAVAFTISLLDAERGVG